MFMHDSSRLSARGEKNKTHISTNDTACFNRFRVLSLLLKTENDHNSRIMITQASVSSTNEHLLNLT